MKSHLIHRLSLLFLLVLSSSPSRAIQPSVEGNLPLLDSSSPDMSSEEKLQICKDEELGVKLLCNPDWELQTGKEAILIIISSDPAVTLTIARQKSPIVSLEQLSNSLLTELGQYEEGFDTERTRLANQEAIKVKGFYKNYSQVRLLDYYLVHDSFLYMILFSVNPKEEWDHYKFLIKKVAESLSFIDSDDVSSY